MAQEKEYHFSSIQDMYKFLHSGNIEDFLIDFGGMLKQAVKIRENAIRVAEAMEMHVDFDEIEVVQFGWIDDGEHDESKASITINEDQLPKNNSELSEENLLKLLGYSKHLYQEEQKLVSDIMQGAERLNEENRSLKEALIWINEAFGACKNPDFDFTLGDYIKETLGSEV